MTTRQLAIIERGKRFMAQSRDELYEATKLLFGVTIPRTKVCPGHQTPFDAYADAYFRENANAVWFASRGLAGKSTTLGTLQTMELIAGMNITTLGGSGQQSGRVHEVMDDCWKHEDTRLIEGVPVSYESPKWALERYPAGWQYKTIWGNWARALTASETSVRGPHPHRLHIDEADEVDIKLLDSALGQPMASKSFDAGTVICSTRQYASGTMDEMLRRAAERHWPVYEWCYKETSNPIDGWCTEEMIQEAKERVTDRMWRIEYELEEPSTEGRAIAAHVLQRMFGQGDDWTDEPEMYKEFEAPLVEGLYVTSADWAKDVDWTVILTYRYDCNPAQLVAYERMQKLPWPYMISRYMRRLKRYPGKGIHDATGMGKVIDDYLPRDTDEERKMARSIEGFTISGSNKMNLYNDYILTLENDGIRQPRIATMVTDHRYLRLAEIYGNEHTPDTICAAALACQVIKGAQRPKRNKSRVLRVRRWS